MPGFRGLINEDGDTWQILRDLFLMIKDRILKNLNCMAKLVFCQKKMCFYFFGL